LPNNNRALQPAGSIQYEPLNNFHDVNNFVLDDPDDSLTVFIRDQALDFDSLLISKTMVACVDRRIVGFISTTCTEIKFEYDDYPVCRQVDHPVNHFKSKPAVKITRFAVDKSYQGQGIGGNLLALCLASVVANILPHTGCRFLVLDARGDKVDFYNQYGFELLNTQDNVARDYPLMFVDLLELI
jgi:predicted N-acetyltransferase YhbS